MTVVSALVPTPMDTGSSLAAILAIGSYAQESFLRFMSLGRGLISLLLWILCLYCQSLSVRLIENIKMYLPNDRD